MLIVLYSFVLQHHRGDVRQLVMLIDHHGTVGVDGLFSRIQNHVDHGVDVGAVLLILFDVDCHTFSGGNPHSMMKI